jgi:hypothetical protein
VKKLNHLMAYLLSNYPHREELSNSRLTKMVYLCDWKSALDRGHQITSIEWYYDNFGPYVFDIVNAAKDNPDLFDIVRTSNPFGTDKCLIEIKSPVTKPNLSTAEVRVADHVIAKTKDKSFSDFIRLVYSTYPIVKGERFSTLDLASLADEYKNIYRDQLTEGNTEK